MPDKMATGSRCTTACPSVENKTGKYSVYISQCVYHAVEYESKFNMHSFISLINQPLIPVVTIYVAVQQINADCLSRDLQLMMVDTEAKTSTIFRIL